MSKLAEVLVVPHELQGPGFSSFIDDPAYSQMVDDFIHGVDFVFEEASGRNPSIARSLAESILGEGHYIDVDPPPNERASLGITEQTGGACPIDPCQEIKAGIPPDMYRWERVAAHGRREEFWVQRIQRVTFQNALVICGLAHGLSLAFRLTSAGINTEKVFWYSPYHKLCARPHTG